MAISRMPPSKVLAKLNASRKYSWACGVATANGGEMSTLWPAPVASGTKTLVLVFGGAGNSSSPTFGILAGELVVVIHGGSAPVLVLVQPGDSAGGGPSSKSSTSGWLGMPR